MWGTEEYEFDGNRNDNGEWQRDILIVDQLCEGGDNLVVLVLPAA